MVASQGVVQLAIVNWHSRFRFQGLVSPVPDAFQKQVEESL